MDPFVILLTGTISVSNVPNLLMTDTNQREIEYYKSIKKWTSLGYPVIFCENSNYDSHSIAGLVKQHDPLKFEYLKFSTMVSHLGKGRGEAEILDYVFKNSRLIYSHSVICKATGKNFVANAKQLIEQTLHPANAGNFVTAILKANMTYADSRFFFFNKGFYLDYWVKYIDQIDEHNGTFLEHTLARSIHSALADGKKWSMLPYLPVYEGYYGTAATPYRNGIFKVFSKKIWYAIRRKAFSSRV